MTPQTAVAIAEERLATGATYRELARLFDVSKDAVYRVLTKPEIVDVLETGMREQIKLIPKALSKLDKQLDSDNESIAQGAIKIVTQNTGLAPSHAPSIILQKITNNTNITVLSDRLERVLRIADGQAAPPDDAQEIIDIC